MYYMDTNQAKTFIQNFIDQIINPKNYERIDDFVDPDALWHGTTGEISGTGSFKDQTTNSIGQEAFADTKMTVNEMVAEETDHSENWDIKVSVRFTHTAKSVGSFFGKPPTNKEVQWNGIAVYTIKNAKIVDIWTIEDFFALLVQLQVIEIPV
jgi:predicted ester cyclase